MKQKVDQLSTEQQLLQARERGLQEASEVHAMRAHGKVLGMDAFSWNNPEIDNLIMVINSFPFAVNWVGPHDQIKKCLEVSPELTFNIQSIIIYDRTSLQLDRDTLSTIPNVACLEGTEDALSLLKAMHRQKNIFLFTTGIDHEKSKAVFNAFIEENK